METVVLTTIQKNMAQPWQIVRTVNTGSGSSYKARRLVRFGRLHSSSSGKPQKLCKRMGGQASYSRTSPNRN